MNGTLTITANTDGKMYIDSRLNSVSKMDVYAIFDGIAEAFDLDEEQRMAVGVLIAVGGFKQIFGKDPVGLRINTDFLNVLNKKKEKQNETDAL